MGQNTIRSDIHILSAVHSLTRFKVRPVVRFVWVIVQLSIPKVELFLLVVVSESFSGIDYKPFNKSVDVFCFLSSDSFLPLRVYDCFEIPQHYVVGMTLDETTLLNTQTSFVEIAIHADLFGGIDMIQNLSTNFHPWLFVAHSKCLLKNFVAVYCHYTIRVLNVKKKT